MNEYSIETASQAAGEMVAVCIGCTMDACTNAPAQPRTGYTLTDSALNQINTALKSLYKLYLNTVNYLMHFNKLVIASSPNVLFLYCIRNEPL